MKKTLITLLVVMTLITAAFAANEVTVTEAGNFHILYNGTEQAFTDVNGAPVLPLVNEGTTYLPIRAMSNLAGLSVEWVGETSTINLTSGGTQKLYNGTPSGSAKTVSVVISDNIVVTLDGTAKTFTDANGKVVYPLNYNGTTYLPVRAVCGLVNIPVEWDGTTSTIYLGTRPAASTPDSKSVPFNVESTTRDEGDTYVTLWTTIDTTGYDYLRIRSTGACRVGVDSLEGESLAYKKITEDGVIDVSDYGVVKFRFKDEDASDVQITSLTLEKAAIIPEYSIPSGVTALTDANTTFDSRENAGDTVYSNGQFIRHNKSPWEDVDYITFQNAGYSTITFTVTTKSMEMYVAVFQPTALGSIDALDAVQEANTTKTYTADISNLSTIAVSTWTAGEYCDSIITNMYVK